MNCERFNQVHAYHDGELPAGERDSLEAHLNACPACSELLSELRGLSRLIAAAQFADVSPDVMQRLRNARYVLPDTGVLRIAGWLTAAAAAVLLSALLFFPRETGNDVIVSADLLDTVETVALTPPVESTDQNRSELVALAQWIADDLSVSERH